MAARRKGGMAMSPKILIVDDAPDWREILAGLIVDFYPAYTVITAASIDEAKNKLALENFNLAILDIRLDDSDEGNTEGLLLTEFIHAHHPQTQVLIITGYGNLDTVERAMQPNEAGVRLAVDYIEKDKIHTELLSRISMLLDK
jgi:DNA-binding NtrC family response regulator